MADSTLFSGYWSFNWMIAGLFIRAVPAINGYKSLRIRAGINEK